MDFTEFDRIVRTFAYGSDDVCVEPGKVIIQIHDDIIQAKLDYDSDGEMIVFDNEVRMAPRNWIVQRLARIDILAGRITDLAQDEESSFISPTGFMTQTADGGESASDQPVNDTLTSMVKSLGDHIPGATSVLYLTAAAGEGKTTLIKQLAWLQAKAYKKKESSWLLVPIELGGRRIIRLDDHIAGSLANTFRFPYLYYGTFMELVKMGVIVPALDGFEEMFVENATRDVLSALGSLLNTLHSRGNLLIAARNAYFEYHGLETQSRLFDCIDKDVNVLFSRIGIAPWKKEQFCEYATKRGLSSPESLYKPISDELGQDHPILVRPVLVEQLCTLALDDDSESVQQIVRAGSQDFFTKFIRTIIQREAYQKWIDVIPSADRPSRPLLTVDQHFDLLSDIALEMWRDGVEQISEEMIDMITELFCAQFSDVSVNRQIQERIKDHALLKRPLPNASVYSFDHEEFRNFFLGWAIGKLIINKDQSTLRTILRMAQIPPQTFQSIDELLRGEDAGVREIIYHLNEISVVEGSTSYGRENVGGIASRLLPRIGDEPIRVNRMAFAAGTLNNYNYKNVVFVECYYQPMAFHENQFSACTFTECVFERIQVPSEYQSIASNTIIVDCQIGCLSGERGDIYDPGTIRKRMVSMGFVREKDEKETEAPQVEVENDPELAVTERALRAFRKATQVNENTFKQRLGHDGSFFIDSVLPVLLDKGIFEKVEYRGQGQQGRFRLNSPMSKILVCLQRCRGDFDSFVDLLS